MHLSLKDMESKTESKTHNMSIRLLEMKRRVCEQVRYQTYLQLGGLAAKVRFRAQAALACAKSQGEVGDVWNMGEMLMEDIWKVDERIKEERDE